MPTFDLKIIAENRVIQAKADPFESALEIFEQKLRLKLTFDGDGDSPYMMDKIQPIKRSAFIKSSRHVYERSDVVPSAAWSSSG